MTDEITYTCRDGVATITLNLPHKLNPITQALQRQLRDALARVRQDSDVRAVVLTGEGKAFCVGADLNEMQSRDDAATTLGAWTQDTMTNLTNPLVEQLRRLPVPTLAAVNGIAAGAGVGLALSCDLVIAARSAYFYLPFVPKLGIIPDLGATSILPQLIGPGRAMGLTLLGGRLPAEKALQWGLIWDCVDDDSFTDETRKLSQSLASLPAHAVVAARDAFQQGRHRDLTQQLQHEATTQRVLIDRAEFAEGVRAFAEKRAPLFHRR